ncbi:MAG: YggS family pyridoxal phosphate-dependent enzyme [Candidatus Moranbacteria bacterium]|nr:YggS family pyridoxal phosphate-dependent enzyme [Candidatus Moranbacteria bacterium]
MVKRNIQTIFKKIKGKAQLTAVIKNKNYKQIKDLLEAGVEIVGQNYINQAQRNLSLIKKYPVKNHLIGHLQKNKVNKAVKLFDMIETLDSVFLAQKIDAACKRINKKMPVLIEINSAKEFQKTGIHPEKTLDFLNQINRLENIKIQGLMTMGPRVSRTQEVRSYFRIVKDIFNQIKKEKIFGVQMRYLSMGMSDTYQIALQEEANLVRIGRALFKNS